MAHPPNTARWNIQIDGKRETNGLNKRRATVGFIHWAWRSALGVQAWIYTIGNYRLQSLSWICTLCWAEHADDNLASKF